MVLVTSEHLKTGKEYDAALIWTEDVTKDSLKVCLREMQNFDGRHEDISVACTYCEDTGSRGDVFVVRTSKPVENL